MHVLAFADGTGERSVDDPWRRSTRDRRIVLFVALSIALHALVLWKAPDRLDPVTPGEAVETPGAPLIARLFVPPPQVADRVVPPPLAAPVPAPQPRERPPAVARAAPAPSPATPPPPRIVAPPVLDAPVPSIPAPLRPPELAPPLPLPEPPVVTPPPPVSPPAVAQQYRDLSAYVAERRRQRGEPADGYAPRLSAENARRERAIAENLASINLPQGEARHSGGLFQITRLGRNDAEFTFFGWHDEIKRRASQRIEVRRGSEPDIRIAIVRRMIAIIRQYEQEDFTWRSNRLGRDVTLSARHADTAGLEDFLLREFF